MLRAVYYFFVPWARPVPVPTLTQRINAELLQELHELLDAETEEERATHNVLMRRARVLRLRRLIEEMNDANQESLFQ